MLPIANSGETGSVTSKSLFQNLPGGLLDKFRRVYKLFCSVYEVVVFVYFPNCCVRHDRRAGHPTVGGNE
jgi:hypothetical protein